MQALARLVVLAPQAVGAAQVEEHHGPSRGHTAGVTEGGLLPCCMHTVNHPVRLVFGHKFFFYGLSLEQKSTHRTRRVRLLCPTLLEQTQTAR